MHDEHAAHRGRAGFFLVRLRAFLADVLPDLKFPQFPDHVWPYDQRHEQRCQAGKHSAEREVTEDPERAEVRK